jgi:hypothetical protein
VLLEAQGAVDATQIVAGGPGRVRRHAQHHQHGGQQQAVLKP